MDTLHSIDRSGRWAGVLGSQCRRLFGSLAYFQFLLYKDADNIPHHTNPQMLVAQPYSRTSDSLRIIEGMNYVKLDAEMSEPEEGTITVYNILGQEAYLAQQSFNPGENITYLDTHGWPSGSYIAIVTGEHGSLAANFIIQH